MEAGLVQLLGCVPANTGGVLLMMLACYGAGRALLRKCLPEEAGYEFLTSISLGMGLFAWWGLAAGKALLTCPAAFAAILPASAALWGLLELFRQGDPRGKIRDNLEMWIVLIALGGWFLASAVFFPYSWDEQTYQIAVPADWLAAGSTAPRADLPYSAFPLLPQFLLLQLFRLGGIGTAKGLILGCFLLLAGGLYRELRESAGCRTAWVLSGILILSPLYGTMMREFYAEIFVALPMLAALRITRRKPELSPGTAVLLGMLAGMCPAVKLTGAGAALAAGALVLRMKPDRRGLLCFCGSCALFVLGFYFRPWVTLGNPVYPFCGTLFGTPGPLVEACHRAMGETHYGPGKLYGAVWGWLFTGVSETIYDGIIAGAAVPVLFAGTVITGYMQFRRKKLSRNGGNLLITLGILYLFWAATSQQTRFMLPMIPVLLLAAAETTNGFSLKFRKFAGIGLLVLAVCWVEPWVWKHGFYAWGYWRDARLHPERALSAALREKGLFSIYSYLAKHTPENAGVLLVFERRGLYCPRGYRHGTPGFQEWFDYTRYPDWTGELARRGIRYLVIGSSRKNPDVQESFIELEQAFSEAIYQELRKGKLVNIPVPGSDGFLLLALH